MAVVGGRCLTSTQNWQQVSNGYTVSYVSLFSMDSNLLGFLLLPSVYYSLIFQSLGMLHAGIGPTHVNAILTSMNVPAVSESTLRSREWEVGPVIENVGKISCLEALEREKSCWVSENIYQEPSSRNVSNIAIGSSYDMGWQKWGKDITTLQINVLYIGTESPYVVNTAIGYFFFLR